MENKFELPDYDKHMKLISDMDNIVNNISRAIKELGLLGDHLRVKKDFEGLQILEDVFNYMRGKL